MITENKNINKKTSIGYGKEISQQFKLNTVKHCCVNVSFFSCFVATIGRLTLIQKGQSSCHFHKQACSVFFSTSKTHARIDVVKKRVITSRTNLAYGDTPPIGDITTWEDFLC